MSLPHVTGQQKRITLTGTIVGHGHADPIWYTPWKGQVVSVNVQALIGSALTGLSVQGFVDNTIGAGIRVAANNGHGVSGSATNVPQFPPWDADCSGRWTLELDTEEVFDYPSHSSTLDGIPNYGGPRVVDWPYGHRLWVYERTRVGGLATASITMGGVSVTASGTIGTATNLPQTYPVWRQLGAWAVGTSQVAQCGLEFLDWTEKGYDYTVGPVTCSADGVSVSGGTGGGTLTSYCSPPRRFHAEGALRSGTVSWPGSGIVRLKRKAGEDYTELEAHDGWTADYTQENYRYNATLNGSVCPTFALDETAPVQAWLIPDAPDGTAEWRMLQHGWVYDILEMGQAASYPVDGGYSLGSGTVTRTLTTASFGGYRWLQIPLSVPFATCTLTIGTKVWNVQANDTGYAYVDLCSPSNASIEADTLSCRWPWPLDVDTVSGAGALWGCERVAGYTLADFSGGTVTIPADGVRLARRDHTRVTWTPEYQSWRDDGTLVQRRQFAVGCTDGRRSYENEDGFLFDEVPISDSIATFVNEIGTVDSGYVRHPGWAGTIGTAYDVADGTAYSNIRYGYFNRNRAASSLFGGGAVWRPLGGTAYGWVYGADYDQSSQATTIPAQVLYDEIEWYPGAGDVFGHMGTANGGTVTHLRFHRFLRGNAEGIVVSQGDGGPVVGVQVQLADAATEDGRGSGDTDEFGHYQTGTGYGLGGVLHTVHAHAGGATPTGTVTIHSRNAHRVALRGLVAGGNTSYDVCDSGRHLRAYDAAGSVWVQTAVDPGGATWGTPLPVAAGSAPCCIWQVPSIDEPACVAYTVSGVVYARRSWDLGATWGGPVTIGGGTHSAMVSCDDGRLWSYRVDGTAIVGCCLDQNLGTVVPDTVVVASGVDASGIGAGAYGMAQGGWAINLTYNSGGVVRTLRSSDGVTFV